MKQLSIIVVNYRVKKFLKDCIQSCLYAIKNIDAEIIVVDNNSLDGSQELISELFPQVKWIQNTTNLGFSKANNIGVMQSSGKYTLILNPDTIIPPDIFEKIIPFAQSAKNFGALGVRIVDIDNNYRPESKRNLPNPKNAFNKLFSQIVSLKKNRQLSGYYNTILGEFEIGKVEVLTGCFLLTTKKIYTEVGGFDESYFMYGEDIDLSYTILKSGYKNYYYGKTSIIHYKGAATNKDKLYYKNFFNAMEIFVRKYFKKPYIIYIFLLLGLKTRYYLALFIYTIQKYKK
ncbi:MAG: glycosyltransferase family 2 protein [Apibacter sp.]|nr:glycosyltransferase family 2 protein [Apibacter sp.]